MPRIVHYQPWSMLNQLQQEIDHLFARHFDREDPSAHLHTNAWTPAADVVEDSDRYRVLLDIPGVDPGTIDVHVENGTLVISGQREASDNEHYRRQERPGGAFERRFGLPESVDSEAISAKSRHGVLEVTIPKRRQSLARKITVES